MSKRIVFGRLRFEHGDRHFKIEMRANALYIREHRSRMEWRVPFEWLLRFCKTQLEIFDETDQKQIPRPGGQDIWPTPGAIQGPELKKQDGDVSVPLPMRDAEVHSGEPPIQG